MSKINKKDKITEKINKNILKKSKTEQKIIKKAEKKLSVVKKIKDNALKKETNSSLQAICEVVEILDSGYVLKIIKNPTIQINTHYRINDLFKFITFNDSYNVGDIIEYTFDSPLTRRSELLIKKEIIDIIEEDETELTDKEIKEDEKEDDKEEKEDEKDEKDDKDKDEKDDKDKDKD